MKQFLPFSRWVLPVLMFSLAALPEAKASPGDTLFYDAFDSLTLSSKWTARPGAGGGVVGVYGSIQSIHADVNGSGSSYGVILGRLSDGSTVTNALDLSLELRGESNLTLEFSLLDFNDNNSPTDAIYFSDDGTTFTKVYQFNHNGADVVFGTISLDIDYLASQNGLSLTDSFVVRFQQTGRDDFSYSGGEDGIAIDEVTVLRSPTYASIPFYDGFESGKLDSMWRIGHPHIPDTTYAGVIGMSDGLIRVTGSRQSVGSTRSKGANGLIMGSSFDGTFNISVVDLHLDLEGERDLTLEFDLLDFNDNNHEGDGVYFSDDAGKTFEKVYQFNHSGADIVFGTISLDMDHLAATNGLSLTDSFVVRFQHIGADDFSYSRGEDGIAIDEVTVLRSPTYASIPFYDGFESGKLDSMWRVGHPHFPDTTYTGTAGFSDALVKVTGTQQSTNARRSGNYGLALGSGVDGTTTVAVLDLHLDLAGENEVELNFSIKDFIDNTQAGDGIFFSDDAGQAFTQVYSFDPSGYTNDSYGQLYLDLDYLASNNGLALTDSFVVRFQQVGSEDFSYSGGEDGFLFDDIVVRPSPVRYAKLPFSEDFESGTLDSMWRISNAHIPDTTGADFSARPGAFVSIRNSFQSANTRIFGSNGLLLGRNSDGGLTSTPIDLHLKLGDQENVHLNFWAKDFVDETNPNEGIFFSQDGGLNFVQIHNFNTSSWNGNVKINLALDTLVSNQGLSLTDSSVIRFQQVGVGDFSYNGSEDGIIIDQISIEPRLALTDFSPKQGSAGTQVSFTGYNFSDSVAGNTVTFDGVEATVLYASKDSLVAVVPDGVRGRFYPQVKVGDDSVKTTEFYNVDVTFPDGLILYYPFDGDATDHSGYENDGSVSGAVLDEGRYGDTDGAYRFDGVNDQINIGNQVKPNFPVTMMAWVKTDPTFSGEGTIIINDDVVNRRYYGLRFQVTSAGQVSLQIGSGGIASPSSRKSKWTSAGQIQSNQWHHVTAVINGMNDIRIYVDGEEKSSGYGSGTASSMGYSSADGLVGYYSWSGFNRMFDGSIEQVRVYDQGLSTNEIYQIYCAESPTSCGDILVESVTPETGTDDLPNTLTSLTARFDKGISAGTGSLYLVNATQGDSTAFDINSSAITIAGDSLVVSLNETGTFRDQYYVTIDSGAVLDSVGSTAFHGISSDRFWRFGIQHEPATALDFDGNNDDITGSGINLANSSFSFECWFNTDDLSARRMSLFGAGSTTSTRQAMHLVLLEDRQNIRIGFFGDDVNLPWTRTTGWHHFAVSHDATTRRSTVYIDGIEIGSGTHSGNFNGNSNWTIGDYPWSGSSAVFNGRLDEVRIWNTARTEREINLYKDLELNGNEPGLVAYYDFNQGRSEANNAGETTLIDRTGNGHNGTLNNFRLDGTTSNWVGSEEIGFNTDTRIITVGGNDLCGGGEKILIAANADTILWSTGDTISEIRVSPARTTTYTARMVKDGVVYHDTTEIRVADYPVITSFTNDTSICDYASVQLKVTGSGYSFAQWSTGKRADSITVSPNSSTQYIVTLYNGLNLNCPTRDTVVVGVNPRPGRPSISAPSGTRFCQGGSITLTSNQAVGTLWNTGENSQSISVSTEGSYRARYVDEFGCQSIWSNSTSVRQYDLVKIAADPGAEICLGNSATLSVANTASSLWSTGATTPEITEAPTVNTRYTVAGTDNNGCPYADTLDLVVNPGVVPGQVSDMQPMDGITQLAFPIDFSWFPGTDATSYEVQLWQANTASPDTLRYAVTNGNNLTISDDAAYTYGQFYDWRVVSQNACFTQNGPIQRLALRDLPDVIAKDILFPAARFTGETLSIGYTVENTGDGSTLDGQWYDKLYLSSDPFLDNGDVFIGQRQNLTFLQPSAAYRHTLDYTIPFNLTGSYYVIVQTGVGLKENDTDNSTVASVGRVEITQPPMPDLEPYAIAYPNNIFSDETGAWQYNVHNQGTADLLTGNWTDYYYLSPNADGDLTGSIFLGSRSFSGDLAMNGNYFAADSVLLPPHFSGIYYFYVMTDATGRIRETDEANNLRRMGDSVLVTLRPPADLIVSELTADYDTVQPGDWITVTYQVENIGANDTHEDRWWDYLYFAPDSGLTSVSSAYREQSVRRNAVLLRDSSFRVTASFRVPNDQTGKFWLYAQADGSGSVFEHTFNDNNLTQKPEAIFLSNDFPRLRVTSVSASLSNTDPGSPLSVQWTVENQGTGNAIAPWTDQVYISNDRTWSTNDLLIGGTQYNGSDLAPNASYSENLATVLPNGVSGQFYLIIVTNGDKGLYQLGEDPIVIDIVNGGDPDGSFDLPEVNLNYDLELVSMNAPSSMETNESHEITWTVRNNGPRATTESSWIDRVLLAQSGDTTLLGTVTRFGSLDVGEDYTATGSFYFDPAEYQGSYSLIVEAYTSRFDTVPTNNRLAQAVNFTLPPPVDLTVSASNVPTEVLAGERFGIDLSVANAHPTTGVNYRAGNLVTNVYLTNLPNQRGTLIYSTAYDALPSSGSPINTTDTMIAPPSFSGVYYLVVETDARGLVFEHNAEDNNFASYPIRIVSPLPSDLTVTVDALPDEVFLGEDATITYTVTNSGVNRSIGFNNEGAYASTDTDFDGEVDEFLGETRTYIALNPNESVTRTVSYPVDRSVPGDYWPVIFADMRNEIREVNDTNNIQVAAQQMEVKIEPIFLDSVKNATLSGSRTRYYALDVPADKDLRITLTSDLEIGANEMFVAYNRIPTRFDFDRKTDEPFQTGQQLLVPSSQAGKYYLMVRSDSDPEQNIEILAEALPFSIISTSRRRLGNDRVTIKVTGAQFRDSTKFTLVHPTTGDIAANGTLFQYHNSMEADVRWYLDTVALGDYVLRADNGGGITTDYDSLITVEESTGYLVEEVNYAPERIVAGRKANYSFSYRNVGNVDIPYIDGSMLFSKAQNLNAFISSGNVLHRGTQLTDTSGNPLEDLSPEVVDGNNKRISFLIDGLEPGVSSSMNLSIDGFTASDINGNFALDVSAMALSEEDYQSLLVMKTEYIRQVIVSMDAEHRGVFDFTSYNDPKDFRDEIYKYGREVGLVIARNTDSEVDLEACVNDFFDAVESEMSVKDFVEDRRNKFTITDGCNVAFDLAEGATDIVETAYDALKDIKKDPKNPKRYFDLKKRLLFSMIKEFGWFTFQFADKFVKSDCLSSIVAAFEDEVEDFDPFAKKDKTINHRSRKGRRGSSAAAQNSPPSNDDKKWWDEALEDARDFVCNDVLGPEDPNEIVGPAGFGEPRYVTKDQTLPYTVYFENDPNLATASAQQVRITVPIDTTLDPLSFRLGSFGFGDYLFTVPANDAAYFDLVDLPDSLGYDLQVTAGLDIEAMTAFWNFQTIDPATGLAPEDPLKGFLAINDSTGAGQGFVRYSMEVAETAQHGDTVEAQASIVFDINAPIITNTWTNVIWDNFPETRIQYQAMGDSTDRRYFLTVNTEENNGLPISAYDVYGKLPGDSTFQLLGENIGVDETLILDDSYTETGVFSIGTDIAGTVELMKTAEEEVLDLAPQDTLSLDFDGQDDQVLVTGFDDLDAYTIEAWVKAGTTGDQSILAFSDASGPLNAFSHNLLISGGRFAHYTDDGSGNTISANDPLDANEWYHLAIVAQGNGQMQLFVNGVRQTETASIGTLASGFDRLYLGAARTGLSHFDGRIDEVRVWNHARNTAQMVANQSAELTGNEAGLLAYFNFNQTPDSDVTIDGKTLFDHSNNDRDGALTGFGFSGLTSNWVDDAGHGLNEPFTWDGTAWSPYTPNTHNGVILDGNFAVSANGGLDADGLIIREGTMLTVDSTMQIAGDWTNEGLVVQTAGTVVLDGSVDQQMLKGDMRLRNLTLNNAFGAVIGEEDTLTIGRLLTLDRGDLATDASTNSRLILDAKAIRTAEVVNASPTEGVTGDGVTVRQFIKGNFNGRGYRHFSSVVQGPTFQALTGSGFSLDLSMGSVFNANPNDTRLNSANYPNLFTYDAQRASANLMEGWLCPQPEDLMPVGMGMTINIDRSENQGNSPLQVSGTLNNGDIQVDVFNPVPTDGTLGWNLLGNPYPSSLSAAQFMATNSAVIDGAVYVFRSSSRFGGQYASRTAGGVVQNGFGTHIAPIQAFFVRSRVASGTVSFTNAMRPNSFLGTTHFRTEDQVDERYQGLLRLEARPVANPERTSEAVLVLHPEATSGQDFGHEAALIQYNPQGWPTLHFQAAETDTTNLVINAIATAQQPDDQVSEPLQLWIEEAGTHQISATEISHFAEGATVILEDQQEGVMHYFAMNPTYTFEIEEGFHADRFVIHLQNTYQTPTGLEELAQVGIKASAVNNAVQVVFEQAIQAQVEVFDLVGRSLAKVQANQARMDIPVGNHPAVILRIQTAEGLHTVKLLMNNQ